MEALIRVLRQDLAIVYLYTVMMNIKMEQGLLDSLPGEHYTTVTPINLSYSVRTPTNARQLLICQRLKQIGYKTT